MIRSRVCALAGVAALAGTAVVGGAAPASADRESEIRMVLLGTSFDENQDMTVSSFGAIHDHGVDHVTGPSSDSLRMSQGNVRLRHGVTKGSTHDTWDQEACYGTYTEKGKWRFTAGSGKYTKVKGSGTYTLSVSFYGCSADAYDQTVLTKVTLKGHATY